MAIRTISAASAIIAGLATSFTLVSAAQGSNTHPGRVLERGANAPVFADITAWEPAGRTNGDDCPAYGDSPIDAQTSEPSSGDFLISAPKNARSYHLVYCANGYHNRIDQHIPNDEDGSEVIPYPAHLRRQSEVQRVENDALRFAIFALNELAYLYSIDPEQVQSTLTNYSNIVSEQDDRAGEVLNVLSGMVAQWASSN